MKKLTILLMALLLGFGLVLAQNDDDDVRDDAVGDAEEQAQLVDMMTIQLGDQGFLVDGSGRTLYLFVNDEQGPSVCFDECEASWPPVLVGSDMVAGEGIDGELLDRIDRPDGTQQVTYNGWPLYYYVGDTETGHTAGQGLGEVWYVLDAEGNAIEDLGGESTQPAGDDAGETDDQDDTQDDAGDDDGQDDTGNDDDQDDTDDQ